jgi:hypothetical protein
VFQFVFSCTGLKESNVVQIRGLCFRLHSLQHAGLDIHCQDFTLWANLLGEGDGDPPWTAADVQDFHTRLKV